MVVAEMLQALDGYSLDVLATLFWDRISGRDMGAAGWETHCVNLIRKVADTCRVDKFRPIALLSVLYKLMFLNLDICLCLLLPGRVQLTIP